MLDLAGVVCGLLLLSFTSIILNSICIHVIRTKPSFREKPSTVFLANLLITHLLQGIIVLPMYVGKSFKVKDLFWARCFKNGFLFSYLLTFYGVCIGVLIISLDRFLATYLLNKYKQYVTFKNAVYILIVAWIYTCVLCFIPLIPKPSTERVGGNTTVERNASKGNSLHHGNIIGMTNANSSLEKRVGPRMYFYTPQDEWTVFMLFFNAALPFLIIVVCYTYVIYRIKKLEGTQQSYGKDKRKESEFALSPDTATGKAKAFKKYKEITYLTLVLSIIYFLLWSPSIIYYTILSVCERKCFPDDWNDSVMEKHIVFVIKFLSYLNALFSPVIYCFRHPEMKKSFAKWRIRISGKSLPPKLDQETSATSSSGF